MPDTRSSGAVMGVDVDAAPGGPPGDRVVTPVPYAASPWLPRAALAGVSVTALIIAGAAVWYLFGAFAPVIGLFFGGWLLACALEPGVNGVMRFAHAPRSLAVLTAYVTLCVVIALGCWLAVTTVARGADQSVTRLPLRISAASRQFVDLEGQASAWLAEHGLADQFDVQTALPPDVLQRLGIQVDDAAAQVWGVATGAVGAFGSLAIMLLLSVYFLLDGPRLADQIAGAFGSRCAEDVRFVQVTVHDAFDSFLRAQLLQGVLFAVGVWACLTLAQVDIAAGVGLVAGVMLLVPVVGAAVAVVVPLLATVLWNPSATIPVVVALVFLEQIVLNVIGPRVTGRRLGLPPLLVLAGVLGGAQVGGLWGALFGVPVLAATLSCVGYFGKRLSAMM
jgi:predicted PurR-regulated permease PerM